MPVLHSFTLQAWIWPTLIGTVEQTIIAKGLRLAINLSQKGALVLKLDKHQFTTDIPLLERIWTFIAVSYDAANGTIRLLQLPQKNYPGFEASSDCSFSGVTNYQFDGDVTLAAQGLDHSTMTHHFNGKIDRPRIANHTLEKSEMMALDEISPSDNLADKIVASWDLSREASSDRIVDAWPFYNFV